MYVSVQTGILDIQLLDQILYNFTLTELFRCIYASV